MDKLIEILTTMAPECDRQITPDDRLKEDLGFDSLKLINLILKIENEYDISFSDDDLIVESFATPKACQELINKYREAI